MTPPYDEKPRSHLPWLVLGPALAAGFIAGGTFARSLTTALLFIISLFVAVFGAALAHSVLTERTGLRPPEPEPPEPAESLEIPHS